MNKPKKLYLIRHGESNQNIIGNTFSGISDIDLTQTGIEQALSLKENIYLKDIEEVHSSKLLRARKTAELIFGDRQIYETDLLREINFGTYEGKDVTQLDTEADLIYHMWINDPQDLVFPEGDSIILHAEACYNNFLKIVKESNSENIAFVTHSTTMRLFLARVLSLDLKYFRNIPCYNCSITILNFENDIFKLISLNIWNNR